MRPVPSPARWIIGLIAALVMGIACESSPGTQQQAQPTASPEPRPRATDDPAPQERCPTADYPAPDPDRPRYRLNVRIDPIAHLVTGDLVVRFTPDLATDRVVFRLWPNGPRDDGGAELSVSRIRIDERAVEVTRPDPTIVTAHAVKEIPAGETIAASLEWTLRLPSEVYDRISQSGIAIHLGSFFPLLPWVPGEGWVMDPPIQSLAEASISPIADFHVRVTGVPDPSVIASGTRTGPGRWTATAVRDFALAAGDFETATGTAHAPTPVRVLVGVHASVGPPAKSFVDHAALALERLSRRFGPYPWPTLSMAIVPGLGSAGIEYPTMIFQGDRSLSFATTHEVAHQWFYSLVGSNPARHPWMDESLATYSNAISDDTIDFFRDASIPGEVAHRLGAPMSFWDRHEDAYFEGVYVQGVKALDSLGSAATVDCALKKYVAAHAYGIAEPDDLLDALTDQIPRARARLRSFGVTG